MSKRAKRVTISDVAKEASVSIAAVSRILNNSYDGFSARPETKQRVFDAVKKLGYRPSRAAVRLATGRHNAIGLCYPAYDSLDTAIDTSSLTQVFRHFDLMLVQHGITRCLRGQNMDLVVMPRHSGRSIAELIGQAQETVDGLIWINPQEDPEDLDKVVESGIKLAIVGPAPLAGDFVNVRTDETLAGRMAMGHLIVCKARKVLVVVPENRRKEQATLERLEGVKKAINDFTDPGIGLVSKKSGFQPDSPQFDLLHLPSGMAKAREAFKKHLEKKGHPQGVLTFGEQLPIAVMAELTAAGVQVPDQCKLFGFEENLTFVLGHPQISGLRYPTEQMCLKAAEMLLEYIKEGELPKPHYMSPKLIARESCH
jgi:LacI family transcriptional regulator, galactose operon repressor